MRLKIISKLFWILLITCLSVANAWAKTVHFTVVTNAPDTLYIIGDTAPLNLTEPLQLLSDKKRKKHHISLWFNDSPDEIKFTFASAKTGQIANKQMLDNKVKTLSSSHLELKPLSAYNMEPLKAFRRLKLTQTTTYSSHTYAVPDVLNDDSLQVLTPKQLQTDLAVLEEALSALHPGLYRYQTIQEWQQQLRQTKATLGQAQPLRTVFSEFAKLLTHLQCGHTYLNPLNQSAKIEQLLLGPANKLPLAFTAIDGRWYITHNYSSKSLLKPGTEIKSINGLGISLIQQKLLGYMRGDGANQAQKLAQLNLDHTPGIQAFDVYFPFIDTKHSTDAIEASYKLEVVLANTSRPLFIDVKGMTLLERDTKISAAIRKTSPWSFTITPNNIGIMTIPSFATYNMDFAWQAFYENSFAQLKAENVQELIIDIRGNTGGLDEPTQQLATYLNLENEFARQRYTKVIKYQNVPEALKAYLGTWDQNFYQPKDFTQEMHTEFVNGFTQAQTNSQVKPQTSENANTKDNLAKSTDTTMTTTTEAYTGRIHLLVDGDNASSTFFLIQALAQNERVNIVGSPTGGNQKGINGGGMFFLTLPNSQIVVDIPIFAYYPILQPLNEIPNAGLTPIRLSLATAKDIVLQKDGVLERLIESIVSDTSL